MMPMLALGLPEVMHGQRLWVLMLVPLLILLYLIALRRRSMQGIRYTNTAVLSRVMGRQSAWRRHVAVAMVLCSLFALAFAWAAPLGKEKVPRERATVVVIIDISLSMQAKDVAPNRLEAAKTAAKDFVMSLPSTFNVSLVTLSGKPSILLPPSTDRGAAQRAIDGLQMEESTAVGESLNTALEAIKQAPTGDDKKPAPAAIVMLSDGQNTEGPTPDKTVGEVVKQKIKVYTIAYGTETGYVDIDGKRERVAPDKAMLKQVAQATGGKAFQADSLDGLKEVYKDVRGEVGYEEVKKEITAQWAFYALAFAAVAALGAVSMATRWPS